MSQISFQSVRVYGNDAADFLHRVTTANFKTLAVGEKLSGVICAGNSKMISQFEGLRTKEEEFLLLVHDFLLERTLAQLEAMHFSENVVIEKAGSSFWLTSKQEITETKGESAALAVAYCVPGYVLGAVPSSLDLPRFHFDRIGALVPWPDLDWTIEHFALESGVLPWLDRNKGCYPGQEVVEKSLNLGHPARILVALESSDVHFEERKVISEIEANVTSSAKQGNLERALVRIPWKHRNSLLSPAKKINSHW